jgi:hypothetical protein
VYYSGVTAQFSLPLLSLCLLSLLDAAAPGVSCSRICGINHVHSLISLLSPIQYCATNRVANRLGGSLASGLSATVTLKFDYVGSGLVATGGVPLSEFTIAGDDGIFYPGTATIVAADTIQVESKLVAKPAA